MVRVESLDNSRMTFLKKKRRSLFEIMRQVLKWMRGLPAE